MTANPVHLEIELDPELPKDGSETGSYSAGGKIGGVVQLRTDEPEKCRQLNVVIAWHLDVPPHWMGRKSPNRTWTQYSLVLHEGPLTHGNQEFRFSSDLPESPQSFKGDLLDIGWTVEAWLDMGGEKEQLATAPFRMVIP